MVLVCVASDRHSRAYVYVYVRSQNGRSVPVASKPLPVLQAVPVRLPMILRGTDEAKLAEMCLRGKLVLAQRVWSVTNAVPLVGDLAPMDLDEDADEEEAAAHEQMLLRKEEAKIDKCLLQLINVRTLQHMMHGRHCGPRLTCVACCWADGMPQRSIGTRVGPVIPPEPHEVLHHRREDCAAYPALHAGPANPRSVGRPTGGCPSCTAG